MSGCHNPEMGLQNLFNMIMDLKNRVESLHEHKLNQIDINKIAHDWLNKLEQSREAGSRSHKDIFARLEKIESKIECLMQKSNLSGEKQPFRCPVCFGSIKILIDPATPMSGIQAMFGKRDENGMYYQDCVACEGKGIVWG